MSPRTKRIVVPLIVMAFGALIVGSMVFNMARTPPPGDDVGQIADPDETADAAQVEGQPTDNTTGDDDSSGQQPPDDDAQANQAGPDPDEGAPAGAGGDSNTDTDAASSPAGAAFLTGLRAVAPDRDPTATAPTPQALGSLDPNVARMQVEFSLAGAGLSRITHSDYWQVWSATRQAEQHYKAIRDGNPSPPPLPPDDLRYVLQTDQPLWWTDPTGKPRMTTISVLAADAVIINGQTVRLLSAGVWTERAPGQFESTLLNGAGETIARITRTFVLDGFELELLQRVENLTTQPLDVEWIQYGPGDLRPDRSRYMDRRRYRFGYLPDAAGHPTSVTAEDNDLLIERQKMIKNDEKGRRTVWPNDTSMDEGWPWSWFASTNRYFALAVHPLLGDDPEAPRDLEHIFDQILTRVSILPAKTKSGDEEILFTVLHSAVQTVAPNQSASFDMGVYAGPLDRSVLDKTEPFAALKMKQMILYQMSSMCAICTFQPLANFLMWFLTLVDGITLNWAVAIIILVVIVRTLLHPLTKRAQINMRRFSDAMSAMKPELDRVQKKYKDDPKKVQQEQMRLMREHGANPLRMGAGCLPMFLQMPIWIALYAMLYFAIELRHEPAFWGVFQLIGNWPFLADLSSADHFFWEFAQPLNPFWNINITGINIMPLLLGAVFFVQQKYMSPPPSKTVTKEQLQQQKLMKVMMVVLFPIMLYNAPSGLTLYIFTSSLIGIIESRYVRKHIKEMDLAPKKKPAKSKKKPKDPQARAYLDAMKRAKQKGEAKGQSYKKRR